MEAEIRRLINPAEDFKSYERIADFRFVTKPFEVGQEMTSTFKLKRHVITEQYASFIEEMYPAPQVGVRAADLNAAFGRCIRFGDQCAGDRRNVWIVTSEGQLNRAGTPLAPVPREV